MGAIKRFLVAGVAGATAATMVSAGPASGSHTTPDGPDVVAEGLNGPFQLSDDGWGGLLVTEADIGQITRVSLRSGDTTPVVTGVPGASGAVRWGRYVAIVTGEADSENPPAVPGSSVLLARPGGTAFQFADLLEHELRYNPDGQLQTGSQPDSLSNPFNIIRDRKGDGFIVADAGANAVLRVSSRGRVSTLFVPPVVREGACATAPNNTVDGFGCDPVPTGLAYGPGGLLYVSTLGAEAPGAGKVYVLRTTSWGHGGHGDHWRHGTKGQHKSDKYKSGKHHQAGKHSKGGKHHGGWSGHGGKGVKVVKVISGLDSPTGVAVSPRGTVYVSNVLEGAPPGEEPPPGFDPSTIGEITRIDAWGGTTSGYSETGRMRRASNPSTKMSTDRTPAKIGRSMKKREMFMALASSLLRAVNSLRKRTSFPYEAWRMPRIFRAAA